MVTCTGILVTSKSLENTRENHIVGPPESEILILTRDRPREFLWYPRGPQEPWRAHIRLLLLTRGSIAKTCLLPTMPQGL